MTIIRRLHSVNHHIATLNGGKIGYETFCYRMQRECDILLPAGKEVYNVLLNLHGYDEPVNNVTMIKVSFVIFDPRADVAKSEPLARIKITYRDGTLVGLVREYIIGVAEDGPHIEAIVKMCEGLILGDESISDIKIGMSKGLAYEWIAGSRRILYRDIRNDVETHLIPPWSKLNQENTLRMITVLGSEDRPLAECQQIAAIANEHGGMSIWEQSNVPMQFLFNADTQAAAASKKVAETFKLTVHNQLIRLADLPKEAE